MHHVEEMEGVWENTQSLKWDAFTTVIFHSWDFLTANDKSSSQNHKAQSLSAVKGLKIMAEGL